jgi:hypothetical protein
LDGRHPVHDKLEANKPVVTNPHFKPPAVGSPYEKNLSFSSRDFGAFPVKRLTNPVIKCQSGMLGGESTDEFIMHGNFLLLDESEMRNPGSWPGIGNSPKPKNEFWLDSFHH